MGAHVAPIFFIRYPAYMNNYDTWENTESALRAVTKLFIYLHDTKPKKDSPAETAWEAELKEVRKWAVSIGARRIALVMSKNTTTPPALLKLPPRIPTITLHRTQ